MLPIYIYIFLSLVVLIIEAFDFVRKQNTILFTLLLVPFREVTSILHEYGTRLVCFTSLPGCNSFFFLSPPSPPSLLHVSTSCYLFLPYRHDFSYSLFPPNLIRYFCFSSHEIACVHTFFELFKYFFPPFPPLYSFFFFFFLGKSGEGDFHHGSIRGSVDVLCIYSLFLTCSRRYFRFESRFEIELSIQLCASTIWVRFRFRFI